MRGWVKYPFHVRHNGGDYNPGVPINVDDVESCLARGAKVVEEIRNVDPEEQPAAPKATGKGGRRKAAQ